MQTTGSPGWLVTTVIAALSSIVAGAITALIATQIAFRRFRKERMWDRKAQAYSEIIEALFNIRSFLQRAVEQLHSTYQLDTDALRSLSTKSAKGRASLRRAAAFGTLIVSELAAKRLDALVQALDEPADDLDILEEFTGELAVVDAALRDLPRLAKADLDG